MPPTGPDPRRAGPGAPGTSTATTAHPGWPEIVVGVAVFLVVSFGGVPLLKQLGLDPVVYGLILTAVSGIAGLAGFAAASALRVRATARFGVRRTSWRWLLAGVGGGVLVWVLSRLLSALYVLVSGDTSNVQEVYSDTGAAGPVALVLSLLFLAVLTPIGEELLFRGVVASSLLRYGPVVGVLGSALVFAAVHGPNAAAVTALVTGLVAAELLRRSGSVWPGVLVHVVNNLVGSGLAVVLAAG